MGDIKACRICLVMDVKMYNLQSYPLNIHYESIIGVNPLNMTELPSHACYECAALVNKYYLFRQKCFHAQNVLYDILNTNGRIKESKLRQLDRSDLMLTSKLSTHKLLDLNTIDCVHTEQNDCVVKEELIDNEENYEAKFSIEIDNGDIKHELDNSLLSADRLTSDDDEPLSLHKSSIKKNKESEKKKRGRKKKILEANDKWNETDQSIDFDGIEAVTQVTADTSMLPLEINQIVETKKKRGRPRKADKDNVTSKTTRARQRRTDNTGGVVVDDSNIEDYVTIVNLTVEEQMKEIEDRKQSSNYKNAPFQCTLCYKGFIDTDAWKNHLGKHDPSAGDVECPVCKFRFKTKRTLMKHASNHERKYHCKSCTYVSKTTTQAKQHQRWHKGVTYKCQYCDEVSSKWTSYLSHVRIKHPSEFICGACGYSFVSKLGLAMHRTMMHKDLADKPEGEGGKEAGPYCAECDVQFASHEAWKRHLVASPKHAQSKHLNNGCRVCGATFPSGEQLRVHHRREHARRRPKNYGKKPAAGVWPSNCEHCGEQITNARDHWTHFRRAHPDKSYPIQKNYVCDVCGKSFRGNAFLVYHKRTHSEVRSYECLQCGKAFHNRTNLHMHERTHSDARPYPCAVCHKAFKCKGALDRHFRSHTGVKPYACEVCGKAFGQSNSRKLHVRTVHLRQPAPYVSRARQERRRAAQQPATQPTQQPAAQQPAQQPAVQPAPPPPPPLQPAPQHWVLAGMN